MTQAPSPAFDQLASLANLAAIAKAHGDPHQALDYALRLAKLDPANPQRMCDLGALFLDLNQLDRAAESFRLATRLDPGDARSFERFGFALRLSERWNEASVASLKAIELDPDLTDAYDNLAFVLFAQHEFDRSILMFQEAVRRAPDSFAHWNNLGNLLILANRDEEAEAAFRKAVALNPDLPDSHHHLGMVLLRRGDYARGWREYEWRWRCRTLGAARRPSLLPQWDGATTPRTILLHAEQGLGDGLQFCRYAPLVASRGHRIVLEIHKELVELVDVSLGSESVRVVAQASDHPGLAGLPPVDAHCPLMSLPMVLGTTLDTIPAAPYLRADPVTSRLWAERLGALAGTLRVGLVWAGNPRHGASLAVRETDARRSTTLASLAPLFAVPGVSFVSLQKGESAEQLQHGAYPAIYDADKLLGSFADTAALVANLDLVICVDTSVAHLVGGMGKPVWLLSRFDGCWRWLKDRTDSPWYPTMRIFRQGADRSWAPVIGRVREALVERTAD